MPPANITAQRSKHNKLNPTRTQSHGQRIDVPEYEAWLYRPYRASYRKQGFRETVRRIVPALPITYALPAKL